jgi:hypothetical protein
VKIGNLVKVVWNSGFIKVGVGEVGLVVKETDQYQGRGWFEVIFPNKGIHALHVDEMEIINESW